MATRRKSTAIAAATRKARSKPAASACWYAACHVAAATGKVARAAAAAWARALSATTVQATVPSTARPMEPPTLAAGVEQAGGHPGVRLGDAGQGDQRQRDDQQADPGPGYRDRADQSARVRAVLGHPGQPVQAPALAAPPASSSGRADPRHERGGGGGGGRKHHGGQLQDVYDGRSEIARLSG